MSGNVNCVQNNRAYVGYILQT